MRPSQYQREMCMTTAERHRAYSDKRELDRLYAGHRPYKAFTVIPHRIVFQRFGRCDTQEQQVIFRNDDCVSAYGGWWLARAACRTGGGGITNGESVWEEGIRITVWMIDVAL